MKFGDRPGRHLFFGIVLSVVGGVLGFADSYSTGVLLATLAATPGALVIQVAIIAFGVDLGVRTARRRR